MEEYTNVFYIDMIFVINFFLNWVILYDTSVVVGVEVKKLKVLLAAIIGACYSLILFFPSLHFFYTLLVKFLVSVLMIIVAYTPYKAKKFLSQYLWFFLVSSIYGAVSFVVFFMLFGVKGLHILYLQNYPVTVLLISMFIAHLLIKYLNKFLRGRFIRDSIYVYITISFHGATKKISALVDTGNSLRDPISNNPAIVVSYSSLQEILPEEIMEIFDNNLENDFSRLTDLMVTTNWATRFRLIPFTSLGKENGMLLGFKPDYISIHYKDKNSVVNNVIVCLTKTKLSSNGQYEALLSPQILNQQEVVC